MPKPTPKRSGGTPQPGTRFLADVLAANLRAYRLLRGLEQQDIAERMTKLGHRWVRQTVSEVERGRRNVTVDELLALAMTLPVPVWVLLDPLGPEGTNETPIDSGAGQALPAKLVRDWLTAPAVPRLSWSDSEDDAPSSRRLFIGGPPTPPADGPEDGGAP
jgi:transcriptional regulator with XRE-family HTH domain